MIFKLRQPILATDNTVWVQRGDYEIVRFLNNARVLIRELITVDGEYGGLVCVPLRKGEVKYSGKQK